MLYVHAAKQQICFIIEYDAVCASSGAHTHTAKKESLLVKLVRTTEG